MEAHFRFWKLINSTVKAKLKYLPVSPNKCTAVGLHFVLNQQTSDPGQIVWSGLGTLPCATGHC